jgi:hypothetical protein
VDGQMEDATALIGLHVDMALIIVQQALGRRAL